MMETHKIYIWVGGFRSIYVAPVGKNNVQTNNGVESQAPDAR